MNLSYLAIEETKHQRHKHTLKTKWHYERYEFCEVYPGNDILK